MSAETEKNQPPADPMEVWERWYESVFQGWSKSINGKGSQARPALPNFYQLWLQSLVRTQEQFSKSAGDPQELWKQWLENMIEIWGRASQVGVDPLGLTTQWLEMMEEARSKLLAGISIPADPFTLFKQWYDATGEVWSRAIGDLIGTEKFMEMSSEILKSYTSFYATMRRANEEYVRNLQLPTRADLARVAQLVVNLEEKVDTIENSVEGFEDSLGSARSRLLQVETGLHTIEHLEQQAKGLTTRLERVEHKLDSVVKLLERLEAGQSSQAEKRIKAYEQAE